MHCPGCGNEGSLDQKFCRKCGFNLEPISKLIVQDKDAAEPELTKAERESLIVRHMFRWMTWGGIILLIGVALLIINKHFVLDRSVNLAASFLLLAGTVMASYGVFSAIGRGAALTGKKPDAKVRDELKAADTTKELPAERVPVSVPSVTEHTTQLIGVEDVKNARE